mmetsp:Transcript_33987/g.33135  ORF Transcript_33987/g.33135 Transcript_33987/m.33135 type:complete len:175 (+) Transcript_33987:45-569(+)
MLKTARMIYFALATLTLFSHVLEIEAARNKEDSSTAEIKKQLQALEYSNFARAAIKNAVVVGGNVGKQFTLAVDGNKAYHMFALYPDYVTISLEEPVVFNTVSLVLYTYDDRVHTYSGDYSMDGITWISFANGKSAKGSEVQRIPDAEAQYFRVRGTNSVNTFLDILSFELDYL